MLQDVRLALRLFRRAPLPAATAIVCLALGTGVTTAVFAALDALFLRPWPVSAPQELVQVRARDDALRMDMLSWSEYEELRGETDTFAALLAQTRRGGLWRIGEDSRPVLITAVSDDYFSVLGLRAEKGRLFRAGDREAAVVVSHYFWQRRLGGGEDVLGRTIELDRRHYAVAGVAPAAFRGLTPVPGLVNDVWMPMSQAERHYERLRDRGAAAFEVYGRLAPGVTAAQAHAHLGALGRRLARPEGGHRTFTASSSMAAQRTVRAAGASLVGLTIPVLVLLIACVNVTTLLLAQGEGRRREIGTRFALGATRVAVARQLILESGVLALLGTAGGLVLAAGLIAALPGLLPPIPFALDVGARLDARTFLFASAGAVPATLVSGLAPAWRGSRQDPMALLRADSASSGRGTMPLRHLLVAGQVAFALVLLNTAGLLVKGLRDTHRAWLGFDARKEILCVEVVAERAGRAAETQQALARGLHAVPGVIRVSYAMRQMLSGAGGGAAKTVALPGGGTFPVRYNAVGPRYFEVTGTRLRKGRVFDDGDSASSAPVVLVSQTLAARLGGEPLGRVLEVDGAGREVVGVVEDARVNRVREAAAPFLYLPFAQSPSAGASLLVETAGPAGALADAVRHEIRSASPGIEIFTTTTLREQMRRARYSDWLAAVLSSGLAALGMALTAVGLYGLVSFSVSRRNRELGVRLALGARGSSLLVLVLGEGLRLALAGLVAGAGLAIPVAYGLKSLFAGAVAPDSAILAASAAVAVAVTLLASAGPARRAARVTPMSVLRCE